MAELFPIFLKLNGRKALVVGGGKMAALRAKQLISAGARVTVVSPKAGSEIESLAKTKSVAIARREFRRTDLNRRYFVVIAATDDPKTQQAVFEATERLGILCNVVDKPDSCNFYMPAIVHRGDLKIAISTSGRSPALAGKLRQYIEEAVPQKRCRFDRGRGPFAFETAAGDPRRSGCAEEAGGRVRREGPEEKARPGGFAGEAFIAAWLGQPALADHPRWPAPQRQAAGPKAGPASTARLQIFLSDEYSFRTP